MKNRFQKQGVGLAAQLAILKSLLVAKARPTAVDKVFIQSILSWMHSHNFILFFLSRGICATTPESQNSARLCQEPVAHRQNQCAGAVQVSRSQDVWQRAGPAGLSGRC
jgi:hypothetical protein